jgi:NAD-dependent deacetylase
VGKIPAVLTQNIDNLHQLSGIAEDDVVELHGNTTYAKCIGCGRRHEIDWAKACWERTHHAPHCTACDEPVKTATISFGQPMPHGAMHRAAELVEHCDLLIVIGSSLVVWPAAGFPMMAKNSGARLVIVNKEPTEQDELADLVIRHDIGEVLGPFVGN